MADYIVSRIFNPQIIEPIRSFSAEGYANRLIPILILIGFITCVLAFFILLIVGGIEWTTAGGNKQSLENARNRIVNAITGLLILFLLFVIVRFVNTFFAVNLGNVGTFGPTLAPVPTAVPPTIDGTCTNSGVGCACNCPANYTQASICSGSCSGSCTCVSVALPPGTCYCDLGFPITNACNLPYTPVCSGQFTCACLVPPYPPGSSCTNDSQCASGFCSNNVDVDGDGFYVSSGTGICRTGIADCDDNNVLVFPGQTQYFPDPIAGSANNFNYDCADGDGDGDPNDRWPRLNCLSAQPHAYSCTTTLPSEAAIRPLTGWENFIPACGQDLGSQSFWSCNASQFNNCAFPETFENVGCFATCPTGNSCGWAGNQQCISWQTDRWPPVLYFSGTGITRMSCK